MKFVESYYFILVNAECEQDQQVSSWYIKKKSTNAAGPKLISGKYKTGMNKIAVYKININILFKISFPA